MKRPHHYAILEVPPSASYKEIQEAYLEKAKINHPDIGGDNDKFCAITEAWGTLRWDASRSRYDAELRATHNACPSCGGEGVVWATKGFLYRKATACPSCKGLGFPSER